MATKVTKEETVTLQDGEEYEIRPLNIKNLRKFMQVVSRFQKLEGDDTEDVEGLDILVEACAVALSKKYPEIAEDTDYLEENLDMDSIAQIMRVAGGVDIAGDPNLPKAG